MKTLRFSLPLIALAVTTPVLAQVDAAPAVPPVVQDAVQGAHRSHVIRLDSDNKLNGRINLIDSATGSLVPVSSVTVRLIRNGVIKATLKPAEDGSFSTSAEPGGYSLIASGPDAFLAWSINVQPRVEDIAKLPARARFAMLKEDAAPLLAVNAAAVPPSNFVATRALFDRYLPKRDMNLYKQTTDKSDDDVEGSMVRGTSLNHHQVSITEDGRLLGRIRRLLGKEARIRQLNVFLLRNNEYSNQAPVNSDGTFEFKDVRPGVYSMVAAGRDGFMAFSVDVVKASVATTQLRRSGVQTVGLRRAQFNVIDVALVPPQDLNQENVQQYVPDLYNDQQVAVDQTAPPLLDGGIVADGGFVPPGGGGGFAGGGGGLGGVGGGGGGVGGGGGLAGALLGGAAGVGLSALLDDDDDSRAQSSPGGP